MNTKVSTLDNLEEANESVMAYGHFSTIHPGHIRYLKYAKELGDRLVVSLLGDNIKNKEGFNYNQSERSEALNLLSLADEIILLKSNELTEAVKKVNPKILVLGNEFEFTEDKEILNAVEQQKKNNKKVIFHSGEIQYASTDLLENSGKKISTKRKQEFINACKKNKINKNKLIKFIESWSSTHLVVIGDSILDQYVGCEALGMSAEAPVVVVKELETKNFIGGAAIVASHIKSLGAKCTYLSVVGDDENSKLIKEGLNNLNINSYLFKDPSRPTTFKKRYLVENQKLFRVSKLEEKSVESEIENKIIKELDNISNDVRGIVISDFVYGVITDKVLNKLIEVAKKKKLLLFGDVQCSSQFGAITRFKNFSLICPNEREARIALHDKNSGLENLTRKLMEYTSTENLIMKLGSKGFIAYQGNKKSKKVSQSFPALSINPVDVSGAGDALLAAMAIGMSNKQDVITSSAIGCCISCLAVENLGNKPIKKDILIEFIKNLLD